MRTFFETEKYIIPFNKIQYVSSGITETLEGASIRFSRIYFSKQDCVMLTDDIDRRAFLDSYLEYLSHPLLVFSNHFLIKGSSFGKSRNKWVVFLISRQ